MQKKCKVAPAPKKRLAVSSSSKPEGRMPEPDPNWGCLKEELQKIPASGEHGFEGLLAAMLSSFLGYPFTVAQSGEQPSGDVRGRGGRVSLQAKRYLEKTKLPPVDVERDLLRAIRTEPNLDVYVVALTQSSAQLDSALERLGEEKLVDVILLDFSVSPGAVPGLGALCLDQWEVLKSFPATRPCARRLASFACANRRNAALQECVAQLQKRFDRFATYRSAQKRGLAHLNWRFGCTDKPSYFSYKISLRDTIQRKEAIQRLMDWWNGTTKVAYLESEEGHGKSWTAASFAMDISSPPDDCLVLWLDSEDWTAAASLEELFRRSFGKMEGLYDEEARRLASKALRSWRDPILLVLDGVNEHDAVRAAYKLQQDRARIYRPNIRLLFTTRPLSKYAGYQPGFWDGAQRVELGPFTDEEFDEACARLMPPGRRAEIPDALLPLMRIPRYFHTCARLRDKLKGLDQVRKETVLWVDLLDRVESSPQVRQGLGLVDEATAAEVLSELARSAEVDPKSSCMTVERNVIQKCFDGTYNDIRRHLCELRVTEKASLDSVRILPDHVLLGWALYILVSLQAVRSRGPLMLGDVIRGWIEPIGPQDIVTHALFVALQLSAVSPSLLGTNVSEKRAALLEVWMRSPNAETGCDRLDFWVQEDLEAYALFIDLYFAQLESGRSEMLCIEPLARLWRRGDPASDMLRPHLSRWLRLLLPKADCPTGAGEVRSAGSCLIEDNSFPVARSEFHLRLSAVALSIISQRPDPAMIPELAFCRATVDLSWRVAGMHSEECRYKKKPLWRHLGVLMRWCYTESAVPVLATLAKDTSNKLLPPALRRLAASLMLTRLPEILAMPLQEPTVWKHLNLMETACALRKGHRVFSENEEEDPISILELGELAVRTDLPEMGKVDQDELVRRVGTIMRVPHLRSSLQLCGWGWKLENLWPWLARNDLSELLRCVSALRLKALSYDEPAHLLRSLVASEDDGDASMNALLSQRTLDWGRRLASSGSATDWSELITELLLFLGNKQDTISWFELAADHAKLRWSVTIYPNPQVISHLLPSSAYAHCRKRLLMLEPGKSPEEGDAVLFWGTIVASGCKEPDPDLFSWAKRGFSSPALSSHERWTLWTVARASGERGWFGNIVSAHPTASQGAFHAIRQCITTEELLTEEFSNGRSADELRGILPPDLALPLLQASGRVAETDEWIRQLFGLAKATAGSAQVLVPPSGSNELSLDARKRVWRLQYDNQYEKNRVFRNTVAGVWGIDHPTLSDFDGAVNGGFREEYEKSFREWEEYQARLEHLRQDELFAFSARYALIDWAREHEDGFLALADEYFAALGNANPEAIYRLGSFTEAVLAGMLLFRPEMAAARLVENRTACFSFNVSTFYNSPALMADLWHEAKSFHLGAAQQACERLLLSAHNDEEIMYTCLAAVAEHAYLLLSEFCNRLLKGPARERALAVSILPWLTDESVGAAAILQCLWGTDESIWVRQHSEWAWNVALQEQSCRAVYQEALLTTDSAAMSAYLQRLRPALGPSALVWRWEYEDKFMPESSRQKAILDSFWCHWGCGLRHDKIKVFGRKLREYCRGENLERDIVGRMAPWWVVD